MVELNIHPGDKRYRGKGGFNFEKEKMVFHAGCDGNGIFHDPGNGAGRGDRWEP